MPAHHERPPAPSGPADACGPLSARWPPAPRPMPPPRNVVVMEWSRNRVRAYNGTGASRSWPTSDPAAQEKAQEWADSGLPAVAPEAGSARQATGPAPPAAAEAGSARPAGQEEDPVGEGPAAGRGVRGPKIKPRPPPGAIFGAARARGGGGGHEGGGACGDRKSSRGPRWVRFSAPLARKAEGGGHEGGVGPRGRAGSRRGPPQSVILGAACARARGRGASSVAAARPGGVRGRRKSRLRCLREANFGGGARTLFGTSGLRRRGLFRPEKELKLFRPRGTAPPPHWLRRFPNFGRNAEVVSCYCEWHHFGHLFFPC